MHVCKAFGMCARLSLRQLRWLWQCEAGLLGSAPAVGRLSEWEVTAHASVALAIKPEISELLG